MTKDEAIMLAMEAMEITGGFDVEINAIKEALAQSEPVIDKTAAVRIATALGWEPKRKPLTDEQWQVIADTLNCFITRKQKDIIEAVLGIKE